MMIDWRTVDRWLMGEAWTGSTISASLSALCDGIGVRWAGTTAEREAVDWLAGELTALEGNPARVESFPLSTWDCHTSSVSLEGVDWVADSRPCLFCPTVDVTGPLVDAGFGMPHELSALGTELKGAIALIEGGLEPFSEPRHLTLRLRDLVQFGAVAAVTPNPHGGRRLQHLSAGDWRDGDPQAVPLPLIQTSREDAGRLRRAGGRVRVLVDSSSQQRTSWNVVMDVPGEGLLADESLVLGSHHDTTPDSFGANDNGAGVAVLLETARLLTTLGKEMNVHPGRTIRCVSFGAEEQCLQGSFAFVDRHHGPEPPPRFMLALDELATGPMKGVVLQFPELRTLIQQQLDSMNEGLQCHVLSQLDASGDMFPFARQGIPVSFCWRWRFVGRNPDANFGHSSSDTLDKIRVRELKEYAGLLARLLLRLSHVPGQAWPENQLDVNEIARRLETERGAVFRTM